MIKKAFGIIMFCLLMLTAIAQNKKMGEINQLINSAEFTSDINLKVKQQVELNYFLDHASEFKNLAKLVIYNNGGEDVYMDERIFNFTSLNHLDLTAIKLDDIKTQLHQLKALDHLYLASCKLNEFPLSITKMDQLKDVIIYFDNVGEIPERIVNMTSLTSIGLISTGINGFPKPLLQMEQLESIMLDNFYGDDHKFVSDCNCVINNTIKTIPTDITTLPSLYYLSIPKHTDINMISKELKKKGVKVKRSK